jgi:hypothetical protein
MEYAAQVSDTSTGIDDRRLKPRSQVGRGRNVYDADGQLIGVATSFAMRVVKRYCHPYRFEVGQDVIWGNEVWTVLARHTTPMGRRLYTVTREGDERPVRTTIEVVLAPIA